MIGWWIVISTQSPRERDQSTQDVRRAAILAQWEAGADGIRWIEDLVAGGMAEKLASGGYPNRYTALASAVLPVLVGDDDMTTSTWRNKPEVNSERVAACPLDQRLTIDAWDQS
ncbi:hypothetical protein DBR42_09675 [Pelomonas sp. HMWF004]|nr:hypothetical protein DBR42_09675 [Pelomonas sp. HMWF004]